MKTFSNRTFGIEIEAYGVAQPVLAQALCAAGIHTIVMYYDHSTQMTWKIVNDSSIQGPQSFELVSPVLSGESGLDQIRRVCAVLEQLGAKVNKSCGLHVHHGALDLFTRDAGRGIRNLVNLYQRLESEMDQLVPESRRQNNNPMCKSVAAMGETFQSVGQSDRYFKLNLAAFLRHQTIEFRHFGGTVEATKIINWVLLTQRMCEVAMVARVHKTAKTMTLGDSLRLRNWVSKTATQEERELNTTILTWIKHRKTQLKRAA